MVVSTLRHASKGLGALRKTRSPCWKLLHQPRAFVSSQPYLSESKKKKMDHYKDISKRFRMDKFEGLPPTKHLQDLEPPTTHITTLENGLRVASQETYGQLCTIGLIIDAGSKYDEPAEMGATHLMELMAFKSTYKRTHEQVLGEIEGLGGMATANANREQLLYCVDCLADPLPLSWACWPTSAAARSLPARSRTRGR
ncbi:unnamed protein product [Heterosigma akashiwo]